MPKIEISSITDIGNSRLDNEDYFGCFDFSAGEKLEENNLLEIGPLGVAAFISDGMGGASGGEIASKMSVEQIAQFIFSNIPKRPLLSSEIKDLLFESITDTHDEIIDLSYKNPNLRGMGATFTGAWFFRDSFWVAHIGDSRLYRWRNEELSLLTKDHSPVGRLVRAGMLPAEESRFHPNNHLLDQAMGANMNFITPDIFEESYRVGDRYLLCTDGLHDSLGDSELAHILRGTTGTAPLLTTFVNQAKKIKGNDNITAIIVEIRGES